MTATQVLMLNVSPTETVISATEQGWRASGCDVDQANIAVQCTNQQNLIHPNGSIFEYSVSSDDSGRYELPVGPLKWERSSVPGSDQMITEDLLAIDLMV